MSGRERKRAKREAGGPHCAFFVPKKGRYCSFPLKAGSTFCAMHDNPAERPRVPCPLDPRHTVYADAVQAHVKRCRVAQEREQARAQPWFRENANAGPQPKPPPLAAVRRRPGWAALLQRARALHAAHVALRPLPAGGAPTLAAIEQLAVGVEPRHLRQVGRFVALARAEGALGPAADAIVEFGAGRGALALGMHTALPAAPVVLVEREARSRKADRHMRAVASRVRVDLQHLVLEGVEALRAAQGVAAAGKHLCGGATDLALRAVEGWGFGRAHSVAVATCCHHLCTWGAYVGQGFFEALGMGRAEFEAVAAMSSWAVSGSRSASGGGSSVSGGGSSVSGGGSSGEGSASGAAAEEEEEKAEEQADDDELDAEERRVIGTMCKRLIDEGRVRYLRDQGMRAEQMEYCEPELSPENVAVLGVRPVAAGAAAAPGSRGEAAAGGEAESAT